jgi:predicted ATPase/class 3 adenylate cyclase/DNA-binding CsgD family transcriptional regulator
MSQTGVGLLPAMNWGDPVDADGEFLMPAGTVTLLLADVESSTRRWEEDQARTAEALEILSDVVTEVVGRHHGVRPLEQGEGDSFVAAFARASDAVACALDIQRALGGGPLAVRIGIHSGEANRRADKTYVGPAVNRTARLRDTAHGGQVVLSQATVELAVDRLPEGASLADLGRHRLRDLDRPEHVFQLVHDELHRDFPPLRSLDTYRHNLPEQRTPLFGRQRDADDVDRMLSESRLVTLTGPGGCGKTRLALHVAARRLDEHPDGVFLVDLSAVRDSASVSGAVVVALGLGSEADAVLEPYLRTKRVLLVLDNCEQVVDGCAELAHRLIAATPTLHVLATSREPLGVDGEVAHRVPSLAVPPGDAPSGIDGLASYAAAELFVDRARRARTDFDPTPTDAEAIAEICRRLDGVPLALELAAARVRALSPAEIAAALGERFRILTGGSRTALPRQQTLKASVDWSHDLLTEPERVAFRRLAVFAGGFELDAARSVCAGDGIEPHQVVDVLSLLVDKSLVVADAEGGRTRYRLLETIRLYAAERLAEAGEAEGAQLRHRDHYLELAERALGALYQEFRFPDRFEEIISEVDNFRSAWEVTLARGETELMARFGAALIPFVGLVSPGMVEVFRSTVAGLDDMSPDIALDFMCSWGAGPWGAAPDAYVEQAFRYYRERGDRRRAGRALALVNSLPLLAKLGCDHTDLDRALHDLRELDDRRGQHMLLRKLLLAAEWLVPDLDPRPYREQIADLSRGVGRKLPLNLTYVSWADRKGAYRDALVLAEDLADVDPAFGPRTAMQVLTHRASALAAGGDLDAAEHDAVRAVRMATELVDDYAAGFVHTRLGRISAYRGDLDGAAQHYREAIAFLARGDVPTRIVAHLELAFVELARGDRAAASRALDAAPDPQMLRFAEAFLQEGRAVLARADGDLDDAERLAHDALGGAAPISNTRVVATCVELIAGVAAEQASYVEAARLLGAMDTLRRENGDLMRHPVLAAWSEEDVARVRDALGDGFDEAWTEGAAMPWRDAVAYAQRGRGERKRPTTGWASLTPTERQVVDLVAEGMSNQDIASRMFISTRTVESHLTHVYAKLGVRSRTELSAAAHRRAR